MIFRAVPQALGGRWREDVDMEVGDSIKHQSEAGLEIFWRQKKVRPGTNFCYR